MTALPKPDNGNPLTVKDRCDTGECNAQAFVSAKFEDVDAELLFCGHHGNKFSPMLTEQGFDVSNYTKFIK